MTALHVHPGKRGSGALLTAHSAPVHHAIWSLSIDVSLLTNEQLELAERTAQVMGSVLPDAQIHPIHVLEPAGLGWQGDSSHDRHLAFSPLAKFAIDTVASHAAKFLRSAQLRAPFISECSATPLQSATKCSARKLASWARKFHSELIVVNYYPRSSFAKIFHPQFVEVLLSESPLPLLVITPATEARPAPVSDLIFPTDFSEACEKTFDAALSWAKYLNAPLRLFHKAGPGAVPLLSSGGLLYSAWTEVLPTINANDYTEKSLEWCARGAAYGVTVEFTSDQTSWSTAEAIDQFSRTFSNPLLLMSTCHGPLESGLWGSITRDVMSQSRAPVLILRS